MNSISLPSCEHSSFYTSTDQNEFTLPKEIVLLIFEKVGSVHRELECIHLVCKQWAILPIFNQKQIMIASLVNSLKLHLEKNPIESTAITQTHGQAIEFYCNLEFEKMTNGQSIFKTCNSGADGIKTKLLLSGNDQLELRTVSFLSSSANTLEKNVNLALLERAYLNEFAFPQICRRPVQQAPVQRIRQSKKNSRKARGSSLGGICTIQ